MKIVVDKKIIGDIESFGSSDCPVCSSRFSLYLDSEFLIDESELGFSPDLGDALVMNTSCTSCGEKIVAVHNNGQRSLHYNELTVNLGK